MKMRWVFFWGGGGFVSYEIPVYSQTPANDEHSLTPLMKIICDLSSNLECSDAESHFKKTE